MGFPYFGEKSAHSASVCVTTREHGNEKKNARGNQVILSSVFRQNLRGAWPVYLSGLQALMALFSGGFSDRVTGLGFLVDFDQALVAVYVQLYGEVGFRQHTQATFRPFNETYGIGG